MKVEFKDIYIQPLPSAPKVQTSTPTRRASTSGPSRTADGERKYTVFVPHGYDGSKEFPAVLFLHGSGERGDDGIKGGQIGLGRRDPRASRAVSPPSSSCRRLRRPGRPIPTTPRPPSRRSTTSLATYKVDPDRIALTGLSMGGAGDLVDRLGRLPKVLGDRADLRPREARGGRADQGAADLDRRGRRGRRRPPSRTPGAWPRPSETPARPPDRPSTGRSAIIAGTELTTTRFWSNG